MAIQLLTEVTEATKRITSSSINDGSDWNSTNTSYTPFESNSEKTNTSSATISSFPGNQYRTSNLTYPLDLQTHANEYGNSHVTFYISVATDSRALQTGQWSVGMGPVDSGMRSDLLGQNITTGQAIFAGSLIAGGTGTAAGAIVDRSFGAVAGVGLGAILGGATSMVLGGLSVGLAAASRSDGTSSEGTATVFSRPMKRLKQAITLYVPNNLSVNYTTDWTETETAGFSLMSQLGGEGARMFESMMAGNMPSGTDIGGTAIEGGIATLLRNNYSAPFGIALGMAPNPKMERLFNRVQFRQFEFNYDFAPRSPTEAEAVRNIIYAFKYHMHPEFKSIDKFLYIYPSEFDIEYKFKEHENENLFKHTTSVLTSMDVNYTPVNNFNIFSDGMPPQINLKLRFIELMVLTKETIEKNA